VGEQGVNNGLTLPRSTLTKGFQFESKPDLQPKIPAIHPTTIKTKRQLACKPGSVHHRPKAATG
jgi:hypothetical protein